LEIPSFDKKFSGVPSKIFYSLLHSIGIPAPDIDGGGAWGPDVVGGPTWGYKIFR